MSEPTVKSLQDQLEEVYIQLEELEKGYDAQAFTSNMLSEELLEYKQIIKYAAVQAAELKLSHPAFRALYRKSGIEFKE